MKMTRVSIFTLFFLLAGQGHAGALNPAQAVEAAGNLRMLSQQIVKSYSQLGMEEYYGDPDIQIKNSIQQFENSMTDLGPYLADGQSSAAAEEVRSYWGEYKSIALLPPSITSGRKLYDLSEKLLSATQKQEDAVQARSGVKTGRLINVAARQRMLSQRLAMFYMMKLWGISDESTEKLFHQAHDEFVAAHVKLTNEPRNSAEISKSLDRVGNSLKLLDYSMKSKDDLCYTAALATDKMLSALNEVIHAYSQMELSVAK